MPSAVPVIDLTPWLSGDANSRAAVMIARSPRIGIDYARHWKDAHLRFIDAESRAVSKLRRKA